jgi:predicted ribosomally synthesized peptide with SipW-like signal peptide
VRVEARLFLGVAGLLLLATGVYAAWTAGDSDNGQVEVVGVTALLLSAGLAAIIGSYFAFVARRIDLRPEDRADADIAEGAGELGFFSPGSYWPLGIALSGALAALALAFFEVWLLAIAVVAILATVGGLLFEYYTRGHTSPTT